MLIVQKIKYNRH